CARVINYEDDYGYYPTSLDVW
nr:immunoglobulin heavy chain junction region [Macaca mulatta]MOY25216.1 immunoglobulin heavy chain junction region [Macaca mulatta]MOY25342.1 immunoglobulin heavy chain junction region [Macaca mulatta]MOY26174.1 immunoglobulin heavy chain junction region [Macaca mulatta]MOY27571.1 immunoglobulin heavy chain junction region [Macaca mulatta]